MFFPTPEPQEVRIFCFPRKRWDGVEDGTSVATLERMGNGNGNDPKILILRQGLSRPELVKMFTTYPQPFTCPPT